MERKEQIKYLFLSFVLALSLWITYNFGKRESLDVVRFVSLVGTSPDYTYRVSPPFVDITLLVSRKLLRSKLIEKVEAYVNVEGLGEGTYRLRVYASSPLPFLIEPSAVNPPEVRVEIRKISR